MLYEGQGLALSSMRLDLKLIDRLLVAADKLSAGQGVGTTAMQLAAGLSSNLVLNSGDDDSTGKALNDILGPGSDAGTAGVSAGIIRAAVLGTPIPNT